MAALALGWLLSVGAWAQRRPRPAVFDMPGAVETITHDALSFRIGDGSLFEVLLPAQGPLRPVALAAGHAVGDEVQVEAEFMPPQFVAADNHFFELRATAVKFKKPGSGRGLRAALTSPAWRVAGNLLPLPAGAAPPALTPSPPGDAFLQAARQAVLRYAAELPNFLVSESVMRTTRGRGRTSTDRVDSELAIIAGEEHRGEIRLNGRAWPHPYAQLPGLRWTSDYAERLRPLFSPACGAELKPRGTTQRHHQTVAVYSYRLPPSLCAGRLDVGPARAYPGFEGKVYISQSTHLVVRVERHYVRLPASFAETSGQDATDWAPAVVGGAAWLLPSRSNLAAQFQGGETDLLAVTYTNYRRFEASSHMTIVGPAPAK